MALWTRTSALREAEDDEFFGSVDEETEANATESFDQNQRRRCVEGCDDLWDGSGMMAAKDSAAIEEQHRAIGYHETYDKSQESRLQEGFTAGYTDTFDLATRIGSCLGLAAGQAILATKTNNTSRDTEAVTRRKKAYLEKAARIRDVLTTAADQGDETITTITSQIDTTKKDGNAPSAVANGETRRQELVDLEREIHQHFDDASLER